MTSSAKLALRLRELFIDGLWVANTNYRNELTKVDFAQAVKVHANLNSIAALSFHINYYLHGILQFLETGNLSISDKYSFDMPELKGGEDWDSLRTAVLANAEAFATAVEVMEEATLNSHFVKPEYGDYRRNIEVLIEHSWYHLGQIVLIRKLISQA